MTQPYNDNRLPDSVVPATESTPTRPAAPAAAPTTAPLSEQTPRQAPAQPAPAPKATVKRSLAASTWAALIVGALVLIALLVFIVQNQAPTEVEFFTWQFTLPMSVWILGAAIAGALIMAIVGGVRMLELRRQVKKAHQAR